MNENPTVLGMILVVGVANLIATAYLAHTAKKAVEEAEHTYEEEKAKVKESLIMAAQNL